MRIHDLLRQHPFSINTIFKVINMQQWEYATLEFDQDDLSLDLAAMQMDQLGEDGYELKSTTVLNNKIYVFFMRPKK